MILPLKTLKRFRWQMCLRLHFPTQFSTTLPIIIRKGSNNGVTRQQVLAGGGVASGACRVKKT